MSNPLFATEIPKLLQRHLDHLKKAGISSDDIRERGYRSVLAKSRLTELGFSPSQYRIPGILMPISSPTGQNTNYQFRGDAPCLDKDGKPIKYETPKAVRGCLDVPPCCCGHVRDPAISLWITGQTKKGNRPASHKACAVSILGVWGFVGQNLR